MTASSAVLPPLNWLKSFVLCIINFANIFAMGDDAIGRKEDDGNVKTGAKTTTVPLRFSLSYT